MRCRTSPIWLRLQLITPALFIYSTPLHSKVLALLAGENTFIALYYLRLYPPDFLLHLFYVNVPALMRELYDTSLGYRLCAALLSNFRMSKIFRGNFSIISQNLSHVSICLNKGLKTLENPPNSGNNGPIIPKERIEYFL